MDVAEARPRFLRYLKTSAMASTVCAGFSHTEVLSAALMCKALNVCARYM